MIVEWNGAYLIYGADNQVLKQQDMTLIPDTQVLFTSVKPNDTVMGKFVLIARKLDSL